MSEGVVSIWLTAEEAASYLQTGIKVIYNAVRKGQLRAARLGARGDIRVKREWLDAYVESQVVELKAGEAVARR